MGASQKLINVNNHGIVVRVILGFLLRLRNTFRLPHVIQQKCEACLVESSSQQDHTSQHQLVLYFEYVMSTIDKRDIVLKWKESTVTLPDITSEYPSLYQLKLKAQTGKQI